ncbi:hypothetical protein [Sphingobacterium pedocola]|uniref:Lipoprotein n=1 Tax=Sphingobacterium pedocola TaxID=2082722 RepID=A0ABR9T7K3_9SPHI|nr:hypothetical protein [Sphingobacterium pedocola]MBE8721334.1 hypothetical protein [Sphingobacterium pedocola]
MKFRLLILPICVIVLLMANCKKREVDNDKPSTSSIALKKNGIQWAETTAVGTFNTEDSIVSVLGTENTETFYIRFKKPVYNTRLDALDAFSLIAPFFGSAAISDAYRLDPTKPNRLQILAMDYINKRIVGDFHLHLKREEGYGGEEDETNIYQGRFDVILDEFSF